MRKFIGKQLPRLLVLTMLLATTMTTTFAAMTLDDAANLLFSDCDASWASNYIVTYSDDEFSELDIDEQSALKLIVGPNGTECKCGENHYLKADISEKIFLSAAEKRQKNLNVQEDLGNMTDEIGIGADTERAVAAIDGFVKPINLILGIIVVLITVGLAVFTAFDVCYIVFPIFREKCNDAKVSGNGPMVKNTSNGGTKLRFVSDEAQFVVENCSVSQGKSPLTAYLGKRMWAYIVVSIVLFILLTGNINIFTNIALKIVSYIIEVLGTLG